MSIAQEILRLDLLYPEKFEKADNECIAKEVGYKGNYILFTFKDDSSICFPISKPFLLFELKAKRKLYDFKVGDKVKLIGNPFDEQFPSELKKYLHQYQKTQIITEIQAVSEKGTTSLWVKTNLNKEWIDRAWFKLVKKGAH